MGIALHKKKLKKKDTNLIWALNNLESKEIAKHFKKGDRDTIEIVNKAAEICGKAVFSILNLLNPEIVFFGGGFVRGVGDIFLRPVREEVKKCMNAVYSMGENNIPIKVGKLDNPILVGACKMVVDNTSGIKEYSKSSIINTIMEGLNERDKKRLLSFYQNDEYVDISKDPRNDFHENHLRRLRNRGLIQTENDQAFRLSKTAKITKIGKIVLEEIMQ